MSAPVTLVNKENRTAATVTRYGQLVVAPVEYSTPVEVNLDLINTAYNFIEPVAGKDIVITDVVASANNNVSNSAPADVRIYQADAADTTTIESGIISPQLLRGDSLALTGLNLLVPAGKWVNAKTTDDDILVTIMFYRVENGDSN